MVDGRDAPTPSDILRHAKLERLAKHFNIPFEHVRFARYDAFDGKLWVEVSRWERLVDDTWEQIDPMELPPALD